MSRSLNGSKHAFCGLNIQELNFSKREEGGTAMDALLTAFARLARGQFYVFQPMARQHHSRKIVKCPETDQPAKILLNAYPGTKSSIRNCSLRPGRRGCTRTCFTQAAAR